MPLPPRDLALLKLLDRTPATAAQIMKASGSFAEDPFRNERRVRERMQALGRIGIVRAFSLSIAGGGAANYYKLTPEGFRIVHGSDTPLPHRSFFAALPPARLLHTLELADLIVHTLTCAHTHRVQVSSFHRENELLLETGTHRVAPD